MNSITASRHVTRGIRSIDELVDRFRPGPTTVLTVWAHPDDESLLAGGLIAELAHRGSDIVTVTATAGEHGTDDPIADPPDALAARRVRELDDALGMLGASPAVHLGYGDGTCADVTERLAAHLVGRVIDRTRPDLIVTFAADGVTGHPDHRAVHRWVRDAVADRGDGTPLLTVATADAWPHDGIERLHTIDAFWPGYPRAADAEVITAGLHPDQLDRKLAALSCHASQMGRVAAALGPARFVDLAAVESYIAANEAACRHLSQEAMTVAV